jgi:hypothetical protein
VKADPSPQRKRVSRVVIATRILVPEQDAENREQRQEPESNDNHWDPPLRIAVEPVQDPLPSPDATDRRSK